MSDSTEVASAGGALGSVTATGGGTRFWRWFWRSQELRNWQRPFPAESAESLRRARLAVEVARRVLASPEPFDGSVDAIACDLYRQSIHWSLLALRSGGGAEPPVDSVDAAPSAWGSADPARLLEAAGNAEELDRVRQSVDQLTFVELAALAPEERAQLLEKTRAVAVQLIAELELPRRAVEAIWLSRLFKLGLVAVVLAAGGFALVSAHDAAERRNDLALGKAWRTSSTYNVGGCPSPQQECPESPEYFFHTQDEREPWVEIDLGAKQRISAVRVLNRRDCCSERAAPIVVELSTDHHRWRTVAQRDQVFSEWKAEFPTTEARWVRLRLPKKAPFHLRGVRVLP